MVIDLKNSLENLVLIGLIGTLILPTVDIGLGLTMATPISLILILLMPALYIRYKLRVSGFWITYLIILFFMFLSVNYGYIFLYIEPTYRDYMEIFRYFQFLPFLLVSQYINYDSFEEKLLKANLIACFTIILVSFFQVTNIGGLGSFFGNLYSSPKHVDAMLFSSTNRIMATGSDPNVGAVITSFFLYLTLVSKYPKSIKVLTSSLLMLIVLLTQSRTVLIGAAFSFFIIFIFLSKYKLFTKALLGTITLCLLYYVFNLLELDYITVGFETASEGENNSLNVRLDNIALAIERWKESWLFGQGPAKNSTSTVIDSEYALILQRYGSIGMFLFLSYAILNIRYMFKYIKRSYLKKIHIALLAGGFTLIGLILMFANNYYAGYQTAAIPCLIAVSLTSFYRSLKKYELLE